MIEVPIAILQEASSWIEYQCECRGYSHVHEKKLIAELLKGDRRNFHIVTTVDKIERIRNWIEIESYTCYGGKPSILKKLNKLLSEYERVQDLLSGDGIFDSIKYFLKWGFKGL